MPTGSLGRTSRIRIDGVPSTSLFFAFIQAPKFRGELPSSPHLPSPAFERSAGFLGPGHGALGVEPEHRAAATDFPRDRGGGRRAPGLYAERGIQFGNGVIGEEIARWEHGQNLKNLFVQAPSRLRGGVRLSRLWSVFLQKIREH